MRLEYIKELEKLVNKAIKTEEVPVGAIIVYKNHIISKAYNRRNKTNNVLMHAEIEAIQKASKLLKTWRLSECEMYISLEPCSMCKEIIKESRIKKVYYLLNNEKVINKKTKFSKIPSEYSEKYKKIISDFFKKKR
jgi:tRNA(adenine34) deaminase